MVEVRRRGVDVCTCCACGRLCVDFGSWLPNILNSSSYVDLDGYDACISFTASSSPDDAICTNTI